MPTKFAAIVFADIIDSSLIAEYSPTIKAYVNILNDFHHGFNNTIRSIRKSIRKKPRRPDVIPSCKGDEALTVIYQDKKNSGVIARLAIETAVLLKIHTLTNRTNKKRIASSQRPIDISIGIHIGQIYVNNKKTEGYSFNLTKRIEGYAKEKVKSRIAVSHGAYIALREHTGLKAYFSKPESVDLKGMMKNTLVYGLDSYETDTETITKHIQQIKKSHKVAPVDLNWLLISVGDCYFEKEKYNAAIKCYKDALEWDKNFPSLYHKLARALWRYDDKGNALAYYQKAVNLDGDLLWARIDLAWAYFEVKKDYENSLRELTYVLEKAPNCLYAENMRISIEAERCNKDELKEKLMRFNKIIKQIEKNEYKESLALYLGTKAMVQASLEQYANAIATLGTAKEKLNQASEPIPDKCFNFDGMDYIRFIPPRKNKILARWALLEKNLRKELAKKPREP